ncbi:MAG TPA: alkaline phosphatase family protein, partial [Myxococcaceae bacterium]|nr:alkaline phosphatase family protein [Myxococcaceae bacterium]
MADAGADGGATNDAGTPPDSGTPPDGGGGGGSDGGPPAPGQIQHIIFLVKENRTYDCYFGRYPQGNGVTQGKLSDGGAIALGNMPDRATDADHSWTGALRAMNGGQMNGYDRINGHLLPDGGPCAWGPCNYVAATQTE